MESQIQTQKNESSCCGPTCCAPEASSETTEQLIEQVKAKYGAVAKGGLPGCCGASGDERVDDLALGLGYSADDLDALPDGANLGLGCGAPLQFMALQPGETVLDLGSGAGMDAFLAARKVGEAGKVIGVDMTPEMLGRARDNAARLGIDNVDFREGRLEDLPVAAGTVDAVTSNCVINLVPDKAKVFAEITRALKPGGRLVVSDIVLDGELPAAISADLLAYVGCVAGAIRREDYFAALEAAGLGEIEVLRDIDYLAKVGELIPEDVHALLGRHGLRAADLDGIVRSLTYRAVKAA